MNDRLIITPQPVRSSGLPSATNAARGRKPPGEFARVLDDQLQSQGVRFSNHAINRMESRGINFNADQLTRLEQAVSRAGVKGSRDSLVLLGDAALVVSIRNNTVVTVVDGEHLKDNIFTNIDSAVIA
jgi:flagellar operon protein